MMKDRSWDTLIFLELCCITNYLLKQATFATFATDNAQCDEISHR